MSRQKPTPGAIQPRPETGGAKPTQQDIDVRNLRFYADMFREHEWSTVQIHWGVFEQTLCEIATRISAAPETAAELARKVDVLNRIRDWILSCGVLPGSDEEIPSVLRGMMQAAGTNAAELRRLQDLFLSLFEPGFGGGDELEVTFDSEADCWNGLWCGIRSAGNTCEEAAIATVSAVMMHRAAELARLVTALGCQLCPDHALDVIESKNTVLDEQEIELARVKAQVAGLLSTLAANVKAAAELASIRNCFETTRDATALELVKEQTALLHKSMKEVVSGVEENQALNDNCNEALGALSSVAAAFGVPWQPDMDPQTLVVGVVKERDRLRERNKELLAVLEETLDSLQSIQSACALAGMSPRVYAGHGGRAKKIIAESKDAAIARAKEGA